MFTFAEAFFANVQAMLLELSTFKDTPAVLGSATLDMEEDGIDDRCEEIYRKCFDTTDSVEGMDRYHLGLLYDRDNVVFYGDPAWCAVHDTCLI